MITKKDTYTWRDFSAFPYEVQAGVEGFYEEGYDYSDDSDLWDGVTGDDYSTLDDFKLACQVYDYIKTHENDDEDDEEEEDSDI